MLGRFLFLSKKGGSGKKGLRSEKALESMTSNRPPKPGEALYLGHGHEWRRFLLVKRSDEMLWKSIFLRNGIDQSDLQRGPDHFKRMPGNPAPDPISKMEACFGDKGK